MKPQITSFATRLSIYIISFTGIVFLSVMVIFYKYSRDKITEHTIQYTHGLLTNMATRVDGLLMTVETTMQQSAWMIDENLHTPDSLYRVISAVVRNNNLIVGCGIAFEPSYYKGKGTYFMPYAFLNDKQTTFQTLGSKEYDYHCMDWYLTPKFLKKAYWSEPYYDEGGGNIIMSTYSMPLYDSKGRLYAVFIANISLSQFTDMVDKLKQFESSSSFLLSRNGSYLTHPDREKIMNETIFSDAFEGHDTEYERLGRAMIAGDTGTICFPNDKKTLYAFYTSIPRIGWSVCNLCAGDVILRELDANSRNIIYLFLIGMVVLFLISYMIIKRVVRPLEEFSKSARAIALGRFDVTFPVIKSCDEIKDLHDSLVFMQHSLSEYVLELQNTTAAKEHIESELHIAREIQMGMLPKTFPPFPEREDLDLHAILIPAREVGGDLYDFFLEDNLLYFAIGDVSGKGIPASLFMAITRSLFHTLASHQLSPGEIMTRLNKSISDSNESNMFVTLMVGILNLDNGLLRFCNAGHNPPVLLLPDGSVGFMEVKNNLFVGVLEGYVYEEEEISLEKDTRLFLYTDGITEAENEDKELYSEQRLLDTLTKHIDSGVKELVDAVSEAVAGHVGTADQSDDLTMLVIHYKHNLQKNGKRN